MTKECPSFRASLPAGSGVRLKWRFFLYSRRPMGHPKINVRPWESSATGPTGDCGVRGGVLSSALRKGAIVAGHGGPIGPLVSADPDPVAFAGAGLLGLVGFRVFVGTRPCFPFAMDACPFHFPTCVFCRHYGSP